MVSVDLLRLLTKVELHATLPYRRWAKDKPLRDRSYHLYYTVERGLSSAIEKAAEHLR